MDYKVNKVDNVGGRDELTFLESEVSHNGQCEGIQYSLAQCFSSYSSTHVVPQWFVSSYAFRGTK